MFIIQTIFDCSILNKKNKKDKLNISQNNSSTAEIKKAQNISVDVENEEKKDTKQNNINNSNNNNPYNVPDDF